MKLLTQSRLRSRRSCARLHHLSYVLGYRPREDAAELRFGTLVHLALAAWWNTPDNGRLGSALGAIAGAECDAFDRVRAEEMVRGYHFRWDGQDLETLAVEAEFTCPLVNPETGAASRTYVLAGKLDAIARERSTGRVLIVEHKTSSDDIRPGSDYWRTLRMDGQVSQYHQGARALGYEPAACLYDVLGKPGLKPLKATPEESRKYTKAGALYAGQRTEDETPEEYRARVREAIASDPERYYQRGEVVRLEEDEAEHASDVWATATAMREDERLGRAPRNPDACRTYHRMCAFFDVCTRTASIDDASRFERVENVNAELTNKETGT